MDPIIEVEGHDGSWFRIHGEGSGAEGVYLATNVDSSFIDPQVKTLRSSHAFQEGATYTGKRYLQRDLVFGVVVTSDGDWEDLDSAWMNAWDYEKVTKIWFDTGETRRWLSVRLSEQPKMNLDTYSPHREQVSEVTMTVTADDPWWYEEDYTRVFTCTEDTTDGHFQMGTIEAANPCPIPVYPKWLIQAPSRPRLPDFSFGDKRHNGYSTNGYFDAATVFATRQVVMTELYPDHPVRVDTRPDALDGGYQSTDQTYKQRMKMVRFMYPFPARLKSTMLPIGISLALPGTGIQLRIPRPFPRPFGGRA